MKKLEVLQIFMMSFIISIIAGCSEPLALDKSEMELIHVFNDDGQTVYLYAGADITTTVTKGRRVEYRTLSCDVPGKSDLILENIFLEAGFIVQNHLLKDGTLLATLILDSKGKPLSLELGQTMNVRALTKAGDDQADCFQEAYEEISEIIEEHWWSEALCEVFTIECVALKLYYAYVLCVEPMF